MRRRALTKRSSRSESRSYDYARETYENFIFGRSPDDWYAEFDGRLGFVVTRPQTSSGPLSTQARLHDNYGSDSATLDGVRRYMRECGRRGQDI